MNFLPPASKSPEKKWLSKTGFSLKNKISPYVDFIASFLMEKIFRIHRKAYLAFIGARRLGNPSDSVIPGETLPMISKLIGTGIWNYSFFQFHRHFHFPYWAHRQYNPRDVSFIPRSHNLLSMNQTHRNWVSISYPGAEQEISVDPAGAVMIGHDGWTIEFSVMTNSGLIRPHDEPLRIKFFLIDASTITLHWRKREIIIQATADGVRVSCENKKNLVLSVRPFNMEGPAFIYRLKLFDDFTKLQVNKDIVQFQHPPRYYELSTLYAGDALELLKRKLEKSNISDSSGKTSTRDIHGISTAAFYWKTRLL